MTTNFDNKAFRNALGRFATGVTVITTELNGEPHGMTASAFMSVSLEPPLVVVSVDHRASMNAKLKQTMRYGVSILNADHAPLSSHFAGYGDPSTVIPWVRKAEMPVLEGALAHLVARVVDAHEAGDHTLFIGQVEFLESFDEQPLLYFQGAYRAIAPKA